MPLFSYSPLVRSFLIVLLVLLAAPFHSFATHITGAEITYKVLNAASGTYQVTISVYRDCVNGQANFDNNITLYAFRANNNSLFTTRNINLPNTGVEIIPAFWNSCTGQPYNLCVEYVRYTTTMTLPPTPGGYNLAWARCCRNNVVTNIAQNQGITVLAKVPGSEIAGGNSMPVFNNLPPLFLCVGQPFAFDHSATDVDGDSLVYVVSNPYTGTNFSNQGATQFNPVVGGFGNALGPPPYRNLNFLAGYSYLDPFGSGNFNIDRQSGFLTLLPTQIGISVFAVSVLEYRNGVLLSENKRDFQINVIACQPQGFTPVLNTTTGTTGDTIFTDPLTSFCLPVSLQDPNGSDVVQIFPISAVFGIGGTLPPPYATLTTSGTNPVTGNICWTPSCAYAGDTVRMVIGGRDTNDCPGYNLAFDTTWVVVRKHPEPVINHVLPGGGTGKNYTVNPNTNFCYTYQASDLDATDILDIVPLEGPFSGLGGSAPFATLTKNGVNPVSGTVCWQVPCSAAGQTFRFVLKVHDTNACNYADYDTVTLTVNPLLPIGAGPDTAICFGQSVTLRAFGGVGYSWIPSAGLSNPNSAQTTATPSTTTSYRVIITDAFGCNREDTTVVTVLPLPLANAGPDQVRCPGTTLNMQASGGVSYVWSPATGLSSTIIANPLATPTVTTNYSVLVTGANGCKASDQVNVTVFEATGSAGSAICVGQQTAQLSISAPGAVSYSWSPVTGLSNPNIANPVASPTTTTTYIGAVTGATGCVDTVQVTVTVRTLPPVSLGPDRAVCIGKSTNLIASGASTYLWTASPTLSGIVGNQAVAAPVVSQTYSVRGTDNFGCINRDTIFITVNPLPIVDAGPDTVKCGDNGIQFQASGGVSYAWTPTTGLSNAAIANPIATPLISTTYRVLVTDINGCQQTDSLFIRTMYADAGPDLPLCINDTLQLNATGGVAYQWQPAADLLNLSVANPTAFPLSTTSYFVTVTDVSGCIDRDTVQVIVNPLPTTTIATTDPYVCSSGGTRVIATGGVQYLWTPSDWFPQPDTAAPLAYPVYQGNALDSTVWLFVMVTDSNGCSSPDSIQQVVRKQPIITASPDTVKCPGTTVGLRSTGGVTYAWSPAYGLSNPNIANPIANPLVTTQYKVLITAVWGCADTGFVKVIVMDPDAGPDVTICFADTIPLNASGGVTYLWNNTQYLNNPALAEPRAFPVDTIDFIVTVTDSVGCVDYDTVRVNVKPAPPVFAGVDQEICINDTAQLQATGGVGYLWVTGNALSQTNIANPLANPTLTQDYIVVATGANGCSYPDTMNLVVHPLPVADAGPDLTKCGESPIPVSANGGVIYQWTPPQDFDNPASATPMVGPDSTSSYVLLVTDIYGCKDTDTLTVTTMYAHAGTGGTICFGDSITLQASGGVSYSWSPGIWLSDSLIANPLASPPVTTTFVVTAFDPSGCSDTNTVTVFVNQLPPAYAGADTAICINDTLTLYASGGVLYQWDASPFIFSPTDPNSLADPNQSVTFFVTVTDTNGCVNRDSVAITVNLLPPADAGPDRTKCGEDSVLLQASGGIQYLWSPALSLSQTQIPDPLASPDSSMWYFVQVTDTNGCVNRDSVWVETMYALAGPDLEKCPEASVLLPFNAIGGQPVSFVYQPGPRLGIPVTAGVLASPLVTYTYVLEVQDITGCVDRDTVTVNVFDSPPAYAGRDTAICIFESVTLQASGGIGYAWNPSPFLSALNIPDPVATPTVTGYYYLTVTDTNGCVARDTVKVDINPLPVVVAGNDTVICARSAAFLHVSGATSYLWEPGATLSDPTSDEPIAAPEDNTQYVVVGTDLNGCQNKDSTTVVVRPLPVAISDTLRRMCAGQEIWLKATGAEEFLWFNGKIADSVRVAPLSSRTYWVLPLDAGCPGDTFFIKVFVEQNLPLAQFDPSPEEGFYPLLVSFTNTSKFASVYFWDFGNGETSEEVNPTHVFDEPGQYSVTLIADNDIGCPQSFTYEFIDAWDFTIFYPNAFSPNGDGTNDDFFIEMNAIRDVDFQIFDRWGKVIYVSNDPDFRWDGRINGVDAPEGVYVFRIKAVTYRDQEVERSGTITLFR